MESCLNIGLTGKYVVNFFESLLKAAKSKTNQHEKCNTINKIIYDIEWFDLWIDEYLRAL